MSKIWGNISFTNPPEIILDSITTDIPLCFDFVMDKLTYMLMEVLEIYIIL